MPPPQPWQIPVHPSALFQDQETKIEIPNTAHVEVQSLQYNYIKNNLNLLKELD